MPPVEEGVVESGLCLLFPTGGGARASRPRCCLLPLPSPLPMRPTGFPGEVTEGEGERWAPVWLVQEGGRGGWNAWACSGASPPGRVPRTVGAGTVWEGMTGTGGTGYMRDGALLPVGVPGGGRGREERCDNGEGQGKGKGRPMTAARLLAGRRGFPASASELRSRAGEEGREGRGMPRKGMR